MRNFKKVLVSISMIFVVVNNANAQTSITKHYGDKYDNLSYGYFYGKNSKVSIDEKIVIASDPKSSTKVLELLAHDSNVAVWLLAKENLKNLI
jgi:hypothetical protein